MAFNEKQIQIIEVTEKLFAVKGYEGTSVRDIAHEAGVNVAMISYYFGSKEKLFQAVFAHRISKSKMSLENLLHNSELTPEEKINKLVHDYVDKLIQNPNFHRITIQGNKDMKDVIAMIYENKLQNLELIKKIIQEGQKKKDFVKNVDVPMLMVTMLGTATHILNNQEFFKIQNKIEDLPEEEVLAIIRKKLTTHLKLVFKAILNYEGK
jgi:AcrR family transcriptional regulator